jgi:hypothetical protein
MRAVEALARAIVAASICCVAPPGRTHAQTLDLPEVTVTASGHPDLEEMEPQSAGRRREMGGNSMW